MAAQGDEFLAGLRVPDLDAFILAGRGQEQAVRAEGGSQAGTGVALQGEKYRARLRIPDVHGVVVPGRGEAEAVGAERQAARPLRPRLAQVVQHLAGRRVPQLHAPRGHVDPALRAGADRGDALAVGTEDGAAADQGRRTGRRGQLGVGEALEEVTFPAVHFGREVVEVAVRVLDVVG